MSMLVSPFFLLLFSFSRGPFTSPWISHNKALTSVERALNVAFTQRVKRLPGSKRTSDNFQVSRECNRFLLVNHAQENLPTV